MAKEQQVILTRAARVKAGIPPPTPFFSRRCSHSPSAVTELKRLTSTQREDSSDSTTSGSSSEDNENEEKGKLGTDSTSGTVKKKKKKKGGASRRQRRLWVQCDNRSCRKWRTLPPDTVIDTSQDWICRMHPDPGQASCAIPEEKEKVDRKKRRYTFSLLESGQLVWAKMAGFCPWPAVVSPDPWSDGQSVVEEREGRIYHVEFLGKDHTHNWSVEDKVEPYHGSECKPQLGALKTSVSLTRAMEEAQELTKLTPGQRLEKCVFQSGPPTTSYGKGKRAVSAPQKKRGPGRPPKCISKQLPTSPLETSANEPVGIRDGSTSSSSDRVVPNLAGSANSTGVILPHGYGEQGLQLLLRSLGVPFYTQTVPTSAKSAGRQPVTVVKLNASQNPLAPLINSQLQVVPTVLKPAQRKPQKKRKSRKNPNPRDSKTVAKKEAKRIADPSCLRVGQCSESTTPHQRPQEFCQLAEEAEGELKEMEEMLSLLQPSPAPPLPPPPPTSTAAQTNPQDTGKAVDCSIECALSEMAEIEGLLQDLDKAQLVPYID